MTNTHHQTPEQIYNELREKVALAFEIQAETFLEDEKLHELVMEMFPAVYGLKSANTIDEYDITVNKFPDNSCFIGLLAKQTAPTEDDFLSNVLDAMQILLQEKLDENPDKEPSDYKFGIKLNKKSISISLNEVQK